MDEFLKYVNRERRSGRPPFRTSEWIEHLSAVCYVAEDYVAYGYELIRYIASWLYSVKDRERPMWNTGKPGTAKNSGRRMRRKSCKQCNLT